METPQLTIKKEQDSISKLFRQLFELNIQLEDWSNKHSQFKIEINDTIISIDTLMESILTDEN